MKFPSIHLDKLSLYIQVPDGETMIESNAVQMCARKISAVAGDARAAIDVCRRAVEAVEADCRKQLRLEVSAGV